MGQNLHGAGIWIYIIQFSLNLDFAKGKFAQGSDKENKNLVKVLNYAFHLLHLYLLTHFHWERSISFTNNQLYFLVQEG